MKIVNYNIYLNPDAPGIGLNESNIVNLESCSCPHHPANLFKSFPVSTTFPSSCGTPVSLPCTKHPPIVPGPEFKYL